MFFLAFHFLRVVTLAAWNRFGSLTFERWETIMRSFVNAGCMVLLG